MILLYMRHTLGKLYLGNYIMPVCWKLRQKTNLNYFITTLQYELNVSPYCPMISLWIGTRGPKFAELYIWWRIRSPHIPPIRIWRRIYTGSSASVKDRGSDQKKKSIFSLFLIENFLEYVEFVLDIYLILHLFWPIEKSIHCMSWILVLHTSNTSPIFS